MRTGITGNRTWVRRASDRRGRRARGRGAAARRASSPYAAGVALITGTGIPTGEPSSRPCSTGAGRPPAWWGGRWGSGWGAVRRTGTPGRRPHAPQCRACCCRGLTRPAPRARHPCPGSVGLLPCGASPLEAGAVRRSVQMAARVVAVALVPEPVASGLPHRACGDPGRRERGEPRAPVTWWWPGSRQGRRRATRRRRAGGPNRPRPLPRGAASGPPRGRRVRVRPRAGPRPRRACPLPGPP